MLLHCIERLIGSWELLQILASLIRRIQEILPHLQMFAFVGLSIIMYTKMRYISRNNTLRPKHKTFYRLIDRLISALRRFRNISVIQGRLSVV